MRVALIARLHRNGDRGDHQLVLAGRQSNDRIELISKPLTTIGAIAIAAFGGRAALGNDRRRSLHSCCA